MLNLKIKKRKKKIHYINGKLNQLLKHTLIKRLKTKKLKKNQHFLILLNKHQKSKFRLINK